MVDALHEARRVLRRGGILIDARPDSRERSTVEHLSGRSARRVGSVNTSRETRGDDRASDRAIATVKRQGLFRSRRQGAFLYHVGFADLAEMQAYLNEHLRLVKRVRWEIEPSRRRAIRSERFRVERPVRFEILEAV